MYKEGRVGTVGVVLRDGDLLWDRCQGTHTLSQHSPFTLFRDAVKDCDQILEGTCTTFSDHFYDKKT